MDSKISGIKDTLDFFEDFEDDNDIDINEEYIISNTLKLLKEINNNPLFYYCILKTVLTKKELLNDNQIKELGQLLGIKPKTIIKEKVVEKIVYKERKAKINTYDDY